MPPATATAFIVNSFGIPLNTMAYSPPQHPHSPYFGSPTGSPSASQAALDIPNRSPAAASSSTQYEFIMQTGDESAAASKQKLKTVRSHVMKNYLHQQQQQAKASGSSSLKATSSDRRRSKQRVRSSRSNSREAESPTSPAMSEGRRGRSASAEVSSMFSGFTLSLPFSGAAYPTQIDFGRSLTGATQPRT